jgi:hypothetical protein
LKNEAFHGRISFMLSAEALWVNSVARGAGKCRVIGVDPHPGVSASYRVNP